METNYSRHIIWLCLLFITALGFAGCSDDKDNDIPEVIHAEYKYMATVTDKDNNPIKGIKVTLVGYNSFTSSQKVAEFITDKNGKFESEFYCEAEATVKIIEFADVDGEQNGGEFATTSINVSQMETTQIKESKNNYLGAFKRSINIKLSPKEAGKEEIE